MEFRIADTFTDSLAKLTSQEQKNTKQTAFDLQMDPAKAGLRFHRLDKMRDPNFYSVSVNMDIRIIVHKSNNSLLLCYVDHHDKAYQWAASRRLETHPTTGAAQLVQVRETVKTVTVPVYVPTEASIKPLLFKNYGDELLLSYGVPKDWLPDVKKADEDLLLELVDHLPAEASEALLEIATGGKPQPIAKIHVANPFDHPDALRRFRVMTDAEELERALEAPWEKWAIFLHPSQRQMVEQNYKGPARVSGSAGTGKTIVALHRAVHLAKANPDARVLLTTFSDILANALLVKLRLLVHNQPRLAERIEVLAMEAIGKRLYNSHVAKPVIASADQIKTFITQAASDTPECSFSVRFLLSEWQDVVDAQQINDESGYINAKRLGRKVRLTENKRREIWAVFDKVLERISDERLITPAMMYNRLSQKLAGRKHPIFDYAVVDEAQDLSMAQLGFLAALTASQKDGLFFAGDLGQRIFQQPFSWKSMGIDIRGRSKTLTINYRTSHQIREQADRLLDDEISDGDGNAEKRSGTISVFNGPSPDIRILESEEEESTTVVSWIKASVKKGIKPHEVGVFVRSENEIDRALSALNEGGIPCRVLDNKVAAVTGQVSVSTMHLAKGLEFRAVVVMACDDEVIPSQERIESVEDEADLEEVYNTERHLLYVACTRARDYLLITSVEPESEFLDDLKL